MATKKTNTGTEKSRTEDTSKKTQNPEQGMNEDAKATADTKNTDKENTATKANNSKDHDSEASFWDEARENIAEGARVVGDTFSEYSEKFMSTVKEKASEAYKFSSEFTLDAVHSAQGIIDDYRDRIEVKRLSDERDKHTAKLGLRLYHSIKNNKGHIPENFISDENVTTMLHDIEAVDKKLLELTKDDLEK